MATSGRHSGGDKTRGEDELEWPNGLITWAGWHIPWTTQFWLKSDWQNARRVFVRFSLHNSCKVAAVNGDDVIRSSI